MKVKSGDVVVSHYDKHCLNLSSEQVEEKLKAGIPYVIRQNNPTEGTHRRSQMKFTVRLRWKIWNWTI